MGKVEHNAMAKTLNHLCATCRGIPFSLHEPSQCLELGCDYAACFQTDYHETWPHSEAYQHYNTLLQLEESAKAGCHLCTFLHARLEEPSDRADSNLTSIAAGVKIFVSRHELQAVYEGRTGIATFPLETISGHRCNEISAKDEPPVLSGRGSFSPMFVVQSHSVGFSIIPPKDVSGDTRNSTDPEKWKKIESFTIPRVGRISSFQSGHGQSSSSGGQSTFLGYEGLNYAVGDLFDIHASTGHFLLGRNRNDPDGELGWLRRDDHVDLFKPPHPSCSCGLGVWEPFLLSTGITAYIDIDPCSDAMIQQFLQWADHCGSHHTGSNCLAKDPHLPLRVVDVGPHDGSRGPFLSIGENRRGEYLTLSYRWGLAEQYKLIRDSIETMKARIPLHRLQKTLRDAIEVTRRLGRQYIWIDALCIIQDDKDDWRTQSELMDQIYGDAWLNISADRAEHADDGFLQQRDIQQTRSCEIPQKFSDDASGSSLAVVCQTLPHSGAYARGPLSRGWMFQEQLFSRRILHFGKHENIWQCYRGSASERSPVIEEVIDRGIYDRTFDVHSSIPIGTIFAKNSDEHLWWALRDWYRQVALFSHTSLTFSTDKLPAIAGLAKAQMKWLPGSSRYLAGIWTIDLPKALAWHIDTTDKRVLFVPEGIMRSDKHDSNFFGDIYGGRKSPSEAGYIAPSFSWTSVNCPIRYEFASMPRFDISHSKHTPQPPVLLRSNMVTKGGAFSQLEDGWIEIRGSMMRYTELLMQPAFKMRERDRKRLILDNGRFNPEPADIPFTAVLLFLRSIHHRFGHGAMWDAILLVPKDASKTEYTRIGYFAVHEESPHVPPTSSDRLEELPDLPQPKAYNDAYFVNWDEQELIII